MKIRIDDEYSNLGEDVNIILNECSQNDGGEKQNNNYKLDSNYYTHDYLDDNIDEHTKQYNEDYYSYSDDDCEESYHKKCEDIKGEIKVTVKLNDINGIEIKGAKVNLYQLNGVCPKLYDSKLTDCKGNVVFENLDNACYRVISIVDRTYFEKPVYITWNEVTIDECIQYADICVLNKIKSSCYKI